LKNKLDIIFKEKNDLSICFEKIKKDFHDNELVCKGKSLSIIFDKNEFLGIQKRIDVLDSTLKKCAFDMSKISSIFSKKKTQRKHTSSHTQHASHAQQHNLAYIYDKVYICTHCGRKGHLSRFCYAKLNMMNKNIWV